jgi:hypothetical protein
LHFEKWIIRQPLVKNRQVQYSDPVSWLQSEADMIHIKKETSGRAHQSVDKSVTIKYANYIFQIPTTGSPIILNRF